MSTADGLCRKRHTNGMAQKRKRTGHSASGLTTSSRTMGISMTTGCTTTSTTTPCPVETRLTTQGRRTTIASSTRSSSWALPCPSHSSCITDSNGKERNKHDDRGSSYSNSNSKEATTQRPSRQHRNQERASRIMGASFHHRATPTLRHGLQEGWAINRGINLPTHSQRKKRRKKKSKPGSVRTL